MKKHYFFILLIGLVCGILYSCTSNSEGPWDGYDMIPVQQKEDGNWSFIDQEGNLFYEDDFKGIPTVVYNGFFSVYENDGYTLYNAQGAKPKVLGDCEGLKSVGAFEDGLIPVTFPNKRISILDTEGKQKFELGPIAGEEVISCFPTFNEEMLLVFTQEMKFGFYDKKANVAVKPIYDYAFIYSEDVALVGQKDDDENYNYQYKLIDKTGKTILSIKDKYKLTDSRIMVYGYLLVMEGDRFVLLNKKGEAIKLSAKIKEVQAYTDKFVIYKSEEGQVGVMTVEGEVIVRPKYDSIIFIDSKTFLASTDDKKLILNNKGDEIGALDYKNVYFAYQFGYFVSDTGKTYNLVDSNGKEKGKVDIKNLNFLISPQQNVVSDYFDYSGVAEKVTDMVDGLTVGSNYKIGEKVSKIMIGKNPSTYDYRYQSSISLDDLENHGIYYSIKGEGLFSENIVSSDYSNYTYNYFWNPSSFLQAVSITLSVNHTWGEKGFESLITAFKNKGYKLEKQGWAGGQDDGGVIGAVLTKGTSEIVIKSDREEGIETDILVTSTEYLPVAEVIEGLENADDLE